MMPRSRRPLTDANRVEEIIFMSKCEQVKTKRMNVTLRRSSVRFGKYPKYMGCLSTRLGMSKSTDTVTITKLETMIELAMLRTVLEDHVDEDAENREYVCTIAEGTDSKSLQMEGSAREESIVERIRIRLYPIKRSRTGR